jgi:hypothetical protein
MELEMLRRGFLASAFVVVAAPSIGVAQGRPDPAAMMTAQREANDSFGPYYSYYYRIGVWTTQN